MNDTRIMLNLTLDQAGAVCEALDAYTRLCIGQLQEVEQLVRAGVIPMARLDRLDGPRLTASLDVSEQVGELMNQVKAFLGYPGNSSHGIGHPDVALSGRRAYEIKKALAKVVAETRNPNPAFRGVDYDGLGPRYTQDPAPVAVAWETKE